VSGVGATRCLVVATDRSLGAQLIEMLKRAPSLEPVGIVAPRQVMASPPSCDVLVACDEPGRAAVAIAAELVTACPYAGVIALTADPGVATYQSALAAGVRAVVAAPPSPSVLIQAVADAARGRRLTGERRRGSITGVVGGSGGVGTSAVALALAQLSGAALVDMSHGWDDLNALAASSAGASLVDLARVGPALAGALRHALVPAGNAQLLASPPDPTALELVGAGLGAAVVRELRETVPAGVVDLGRLTAGVARETIIGVDRIVVVVTPDVRTTLTACTLLTAASRWGAPVETAGVVVNRWNRRAELSLRGVARAVGCEVAAVVRDRPRGMVAYSNAGIDLTEWPVGSPFGVLRALAAQTGVVG
jgi:Flp pilus assembly CpaE family ATPase